MNDAKRSGQWSEKARRFFPEVRRTMLKELPGAETDKGLYQLRSRAAVFLRPVKRGWRETYQHRGAHGRDGLCSNRTWLQGRTSTDTDHPTLARCKEAQTCPSWNQEVLTEAETRYRPDITLKKLFRSEIHEVGGLSSPG